MKYKKSFFLIRLTGLLTIIWLILIPAQSDAASIAESVDGTHIILENNYVKFKVSKSNGKSTNFILKQTGEELVTTPTPFAYYRDSIESYHPEEGGIDYARISDTEAKLTIRLLTRDQTKTITIQVLCEAYDTYFLFELIDITPVQTDKFAKVLFARVQVDIDDYNNPIGSLYKGDFIINELALNKETKIVAGANGVLEASGYLHIQLPGQRVALITLPKTEWLSFVGDIESQYDELPHPTIDGVWAKKHPDVNTSYLFVNITEENADDIIDYALKGGFKYILAPVHSWAVTYGHYEINRISYPGGLTGERSLASVVRKVHQSGLKFGLHTMSSLIQENDAYISPISDSRLARINCDDVDTSLPEFSDCTSGDDNPLAMSFGAYLPDLSTDLLDEIAQNVADVYNAIGGDFLYLDGLGGTDKLMEYRNQESRQKWYSCTLPMTKYFYKLERDVLLEASCDSNFNWHLLSRGVSGDRAYTGVKPYMDGFKLSAFVREKDRKMLYPQELGWIGLLSKLGGAYDASFSSTTVDEIEYQMNRSLGYGLPISLQTNYHYLLGNGFTEEILELISSYEKLRLTNYFPSSILKKLQQAGKEYALVENEDGVYGFKERKYAEHYVAGLTGATWEIYNTFPAQPLKVKITPIQSSKSYGDYGDEGNIVLEGFSNTSDLKVENDNDTICSIIENTGEITATNNSASNYGWCTLTKTLPEDLSDLSNYKAIGVKVKGGNKKEVISIQLKQSAGNRQYQFQVDFSEEKYKELAIPATTKLLEYPSKWSSPWTVRDSFRQFDYTSVKGLTVYIKNIPPGDTVHIELGAIEALRQDNLPILHPSLTVGDRTIIFPTTLEPRCEKEGVILEPCEYLVFDGVNFRKYDGNNNLVEKGLPIGTMPIPIVVSTGKNTITYRADSSIGEHKFNNRALVSILTEGKPFYPGNYYIGFNPLNFLPDNNSNLFIDKGGMGPRGPMGHRVSITTDTPGDCKWIYLDLKLPSNIEIKQVKLHYKLSNSRSFISQLRLKETTDVRHDDDTDLTKTIATVYRSHVSNLQPNGSITLALRLNFADTSDVIEIGGIEILLDKI